MKTLESLFTKHWIFVVSKKNKKQKTKQKTKQKNK